MANAADRKRFLLSMRDLCDMAHSRWDDAETSGFCEAFDKVLDDIDALWFEVHKAVIRDERES